MTFGCSACAFARTIAGQPMDEGEQFPAHLVGSYRAVDQHDLKVSEEHGPLMLHIAGEQDILIYAKPDHTPATFTILNFTVDDIDQAVDELGARGVQIQRYEGFETDDSGIYHADGHSIVVHRPRRQRPVRGSDGPAVMAIRRARCVRTSPAASQADRCGLRFPSPAPVSPQQHDAQTERGMHHRARVTASPEPVPGGSYACAKPMTDRP